MRKLNNFRSTSKNKCSQEINEDHANDALNSISKISLKRRTILSLTACKYSPTLYSTLVHQDYKKNQRWHQTKEKSKVASAVSQLLPHP
ncbi:hypothetical protein CEXT_66501 [Caerostris extrusa]|uniref:Uncharacterized protein n=1 Tax=Caerostris extrusa TaxID=172846 RepID=A0AAV4XUA2_CAEEX|nr:hypothetical protein CEXT_66501 [Caerostris extrusa]